MIGDKNKRINLKSKRTRTLFRKAIEVSKMCNLDVFILINDRDTLRVTEYNSLAPTSQANPDPFCIERVLESLKRIDLDITQANRCYKKYTDVDYEAIGVAPLFLEAFTSGTVTMRDILSHCRNYRRGLEAGDVTPMHAYRMVTRGNSQTSDRPP